MPKPPEDDKDVINFRPGPERRQAFIKLTRLANFENPNQFFKALVDQLNRNIDGDFDVRDIDLASPSAKTSDRSSTKAGVTPQ